jgi:hypothetical protein
MSHFDDNEARIISKGYRVKSSRIKTPQNARSIWEKQAREMREKIKSGQDPRDQLIKEAEGE